jgi:NDP-sugar pyrophosphorylase family protein
MELAGPRSPLNLHAVALAGAGFAQEPSSLHGDAKVLRTMVCGGVRVEEGAEVEDAVLMPGVRIGPGARVRRAIVDEDVEVPAGFTIGWETKQDRENFTVSPGGITVVCHPLPRASDGVPVLKREALAAACSRRGPARGGWKKEQESRGEVLGSPGASFPS